MKELDLTICVPTHKRLDYLHILLQTIPNFIPVSISDNGSFIANEFEDFKNVNIVHQKEVIGMFANWNKTIETVTTKWFIIPGDDDMFTDGIFYEIDSYLNKYCDCGMIIFGHEKINENGDCKGKWIPEEERLFKDPSGILEFIPTIHARVPSIVFNTAKVKACGMFNPQFAFTAADSLLIQQMSLVAPFAFVPKVLGKYRIWDAAFTTQKCYSVEWFDQLYLWQKIITQDIIGKEVDVNVNTMTSEIIFANIMSGLNAMKHANKSICQKWNFVKETKKNCVFSLKHHIMFLFHIVF